MSERSAHGRVHAVAAHAEAVLVGRAEVRDLVEILTGELTANQAATRAGVDRSTIMTLRKVARDGAIAALQASRPATCPPGSRAPRRRSSGAGVSGGRSRNASVTRLAET